MTKKERLKIYENFFHQINLHCIMMNSEKIGEAVSLINDWSYAHRVGNGQPSEYEQKKMVEKKIERMGKFT